ncbi:MAG: carboxymuconolactone decarboxylase family protein [Gluconacetobacter diazotrophicus]|nr:carboxymuconolactone decarboxylase family protein [Gluconacetobacter diazotrophicus]
MRLSPIPPAALEPEQRALHDTFAAGIATAQGFRSFRTRTDDGAFIGPFNPWLHYPESGEAAWAMFQALSGDRARLPAECREVAILVVGARFRSEYELYAHVSVARELGMPDGKLAALAAGTRPADLDEREAATFDVATALCAGGLVPAAVTARAEALFGRDAVAELIFLVGLYAAVSITLNGFREAAPE